METDFKCFGTARLYVNSYAELARLFVINAKIIFNEKGSKGVGFITPGCAGQAAWARDQLRGAILESQRIEVKATPRARASPYSATGPWWRSRSWWRSTPCSPRRSSSSATTTAFLQDRQGMW